VCLQPELVPDSVEGQVGGWWDQHLSGLGIRGPAGERDYCNSVLSVPARELPDNRPEALPVLPADDGASVPYGFPQDAFFTEGQAC